MDDHLPIIQCKGPLSGGTKEANTFQCTEMNNNSYIFSKVLLNSVGQTPVQRKIGHRVFRRRRGDRDRVPRRRCRRRPGARTRAWKRTASGSRVPSSSARTGSPRCRSGQRPIRKKNCQSLELLDILASHMA